MARQTAHKWLARYDAEGEAGLEDRSCRPHQMQRRTPRRLVQRMLQLRRRKKAAWEIAAEIGVPASTVSRHLKACGLGRLWRLEEVEDPPQRYEHPPSQLGASLPSARLATDVPAVTVTSVA